MVSPQTFDPLGTDFDPGFTQSMLSTGRRSCDLAMNAPYGQRNSFCFERLVPRQDVLIDTIDQCTVEIEQKRGFWTLHGFEFSN